MLPRNILTEQLLSTSEGTETNLRNTPFSNILRANPFLAIFYADFLRRRGANSSLTKDLELKSGFFFDPDQSPKTGAGCDLVKTLYLLKLNSAAAFEVPNRAKKRDRKPAGMTRKVNPGMLP